MCICDYDKNHIATCEKCFFGLNEGISKKLCQVAQKHTAQISKDRNFLESIFVGVNRLC